MARNAFDFLDSGSRERTLLILLLALIKKQGGEITLSLEDLAGVEPGDGFLKAPADPGSLLVLSFARKGAEVFFLTSTEESPSRTRPQARAPVPEPVPENENLPLFPAPAPRHAVPSDQALALKEAEMLERATSISKQRLEQARREAGSLPWRTRPAPQ